MDDTKWLEIAINTTPDLLDEVCAKLIAAGMDSLVTLDEGEFRTFLEQNQQYWDYVDEDLDRSMAGLTQVKFYVTDDDEGKRLLAHYTEQLSCEYSVTPLGENDWAYSWQKYYKPLPVGERLYIVPDWERTEPVPAGKTPLYLNPGLTFGTGSHASTQLCLMGVECHVKEGDAVLDLGCGSGILSIAALCLGAQSAFAVDIDAKAVGVSYENASLNQIYQDRYTVRDGDVLARGTLYNEIAQTKYDVILANIVADVIIPLSAMIPALLAEGGTFICSGIIDSRGDEVQAALESNGFHITTRREQDGWEALEGSLTAK